MYTDWSGAANSTSRHGGQAKSDMRRNISNVLSSAVVIALAIALKVNVGGVVIRGWIVPPQIPFVS
jgi:cation transporter-like permease